METWRKHLATINVSVQTPDEPADGHLEHIADAKKGGNGNGAACLDLLPVPGRKAERNHILLAVAPAQSQFSDSLPQGTKEFLLIYHTDGCKVSRAETPRADWRGVAQSRLRHEAKEAKGGARWLSRDRTLKIFTPN